MQVHGQNILGQNVSGQNKSAQNVLVTKHIGDKTYRQQNISTTKRIAGQNVLAGFKKSNK